jgi:ureidoacrylate peracid hydrolase
MTDFPLIPEKTAMLFFDALNIYLHPEDPAAAAEVVASGVIPAMQRICAACRRAGVSIFYAQADHRPDYRDFAPQIVDRGHAEADGPPRKTTAPGVVSGSRGAEVIPELAPRPEDYIIKKHRWSAFFETHLELSLRTAAIDTIMLAGGSTEVGIASTAYAARDLDYNLVILRDACRSSHKGVDQFFMERVFPIFTRVMTVDQAIANFAVSDRVGKS